MEEAMTVMIKKLSMRFTEHLTDSVAKLFHLITRASRLTALSEDLFCTLGTFGSPAVGIEEVTASEEKLQELKRCLKDIEKNHYNYQHHHHYHPKHRDTQLTTQTQGIHKNHHHRALTLLPRLL